VRKSLQSKSSKDISSPAEDRDATPRDSLADHPKFVPSDLSQSQIIEGVSTDAITETYTTPFAPAVEENVDDGCYGAVVHLKGMSHLLPISEVLANALTYILILIVAWMAHARISANLTKTLLPN
jgi:hypothetical protein